MEKQKVIITVVSIVAVLCLCLCLVTAIVFIISRSRDSGPSATIYPNHGTVPPPTTHQSEPDPRTQTWLVMFYMDADNNLEDSIYFDLNEIEMIGSSERVKMVAQIDRSDQYYRGDGNWSSTRRYFITQDSDLYTVHSPLLEDIGEVDMGDSQTLIDFASWAIQNYPADRYVLIMSNHGAGWPGGFSDDKPYNPNGNWITLHELDGALKHILVTTGIPRFELVGLDACLMSMLEVYNALAPYSNYAVASQETEPAIGWAYASFLGELTRRPEMSGADLASAIVQSYIVDDLIIRDDEARRRMLADYGYADIGAEALIQSWGGDITLTGVDLAALPQLNDALGNFLYALKNADQRKVAEARSYALNFYNAIDDAYPSPYIDLGNFAAFAANAAGSQGISRAAEDLQSALQSAVIAEKHGNQRAGATGISIYFPVSELYWSNSLAGFDGYTSTSSRFTDKTLWDDFLAFHYAGRDFGLGNPSRNERIPAPGSAQVTIAPLRLSTDTIPSGGVVNIQTDINGDQIAYIYVVVMAKGNCPGCYVAYSINYIMGDDSLEQNGVVYPFWERQNGSIHINLDFEPEPYAICTSTAVEDCAFAMVNWDKYDPVKDNLMVFVEGWYIYADTGQRVEATMYLYNRPDFEMRKIIGRSVDERGNTIPSDILPKPGDQFMVVDTWWESDTDGDYTTKYYEGQTLTFGNQSVFWMSFYPLPGEYVVGIMVEDMDGFQTYQFAPLTITARNP